MQCAGVEEEAWRSDAWGAPVGVCVVWERFGRWVRLVSGHGINLAANVRIGFSVVRRRQAVATCKIIPLFLYTCPLDSSQLSCDS